MGANSNWSSLFSKTSKPSFYSSDDYVFLDSDTISFERSDSVSKVKKKIDYRTWKLYAQMRKMMPCQYLIPEIGMGCFSSSYRKILKNKITTDKTCKINHFKAISIRWNLFLSIWLAEICDKIFQGRYMKYYRRA